MSAPHCAAHGIPACRLCVPADAPASPEEMAEAAEENAAAGLADGSLSALQLFAAGVRAERARAATREQERPIPASDLAERAREVLAADPPAPLRYHMLAVGAQDLLRREQELAAEVERLRALQKAAERWHDAVPRDDPDGAEEAEGALVIAVEQANPAKYGA